MKGNIMGNKKGGNYNGKRMYGMNMDSRHFDGWLCLAAAILEIAIEDYKCALKKNDDLRTAMLERFFRGRYGQTLSLDHGEYIIQESRRQIFGK